MFVSVVKGNNLVKIKVKDFALRVVIILGISTKIIVVRVIIIRRNVIVLWDSILDII